MLATDGTLGANTREGPLRCFAIVCGIWRTTHPGEPTANPRPVPPKNLIRVCVENAVFDTPVRVRVWPPVLPENAVHPGLYLWLDTNLCVPPVSV